MKIFVQAWVDAVVAVKYKIKSVNIIQQEFGFVFDCLKVLSD